MKLQCVLGIDTSNYTTSLCVVDLESGDMLAEHRMLLPVQAGERGLRQSDALFFHVAGLPQVMDVVMAQLQQKGMEVDRWHAVGVSVRPRPFSSSYMPVFRAGASLAWTFARAVGAVVVPTSHQEGHIAAAEYHLPFVVDGPFAAVHISGGTSDVMLADRTRFGYHIETIGEGADLHAGQFVDRVGVAMGLPFPAGPHLERLAAHATPDSDFRLSVRLVNGQLSFSGPCSAALRALEQGVPAPDVAMAVQGCVANAVVKAVSAAYASNPGLSSCVIAGGVASNEFIKRRVTHRLKVLHSNLTVSFAPPRYSSDNALGVATIARRFCIPAGV